MAAVTLTGIRKPYGNVDVIHGIDLEIGEGEFVVFLSTFGLRQVDFAADDRGT